MRILILGGAGMLGRKLAERLAADGALGSTAITRASLVDVVPPASLEDAEFDVETLAVDVSEPGVAERLVSARPEVVFHLAAVVSGEAEADFEKGYRVNLDGTRLLLEAIRGVGSGYRPRVVFTSTIAVFGPPIPDTIEDGQAVTPQTSYGTQKAIDELLLSDYSRRGFLDGIAIRLPTICVRPGAPNLAASSFFSSIIREPLNGEAAVLPVPDDVRHWFASPRAGVGFLVHAATLDSGRLGADRCLNMPGISATVAEQIDALRAIAGGEAVALIRREPDETIMRMVGGWPRAFDARQATELGFRADESFKAIVRAYIEDELDGRTP